MAIEKLKPSFKFNEEQLYQLRLIAPDAFKDNILDFNSLYEALSDNLEENEFQDEQYGLLWPGKYAAKKILSAPSYGTLAPITDKGVLESTTSNIFIEGENLAVLKALKKSYNNSIKAIYIDPPYNTGNDLIYDDDFTETVAEFLKRIGSVDESGKKLTTNSKADGRFHSKWLTMIYPRIKLAHQLLKDEGVIFISIDDNELDNLRIIMNELFGEENFVGNFIIQSNPRASQSSRDIGIVHEYLIVYTKNISKNAALAQRLDERMVAEYKFTSDDGRKYRLLGLRQRGSGWRREDRPFLYFPIYVNPNSGKVSLEKDLEYSEEVIPIKPSTNEDGRWRWSKKKVNDNVNDLVGKQVKRDDSLVWDISQLDYLANADDDEKSTKPKSIWNEAEMNYQNAGNEIKELFDHSDVFDFPKPVYLIKKILNLIDCDGEIVLDFFAGSGTTGQAVYELNSEGRNIRFICVQLDYRINENKKAFKLGYKLISDVTSKRLELATKKYQKTLFEGNEFLLGFKYFKLSPSSFKSWQNYTGTNADQLSDLFSRFENPLVEGWSAKNLLTEILLIEGFPLDSNIEIIDTFSQNKFFRVDSVSCEHSLFICLDPKIENDSINTLILGEKDVFICLDNAISDQDKVRLDDKGLIKTI
jgi:adenine-specific DNA-methyltransferase